MTNIVLIERELENETQLISLKVFPRRDLPAWVLLKQGLCFGCQFWIKAVTIIVSTSHPMTGTYFPHFPQYFNFPSVNCFYI